ncbi:hypothetical protein [Hymenobacter daeguensis]
MRNSLMFLLGGLLLAACQADPPKTQDEAVKKEAVVQADTTNRLVTPTDSAGTTAP